MALVAPKEAESALATRHFLDRVVAEPTPVEELIFVDVNSSMKNGGGPACLRLGVPLTEEERRHVGGRVIADEALLDELEGWVSRHYREQLAGDDLRDPSLLDESRRALDELTTLLALGSVYDFQR
jgi:succinylarginine dihydrolase